MGQGNALSPILVAGHLGRDLHGDIAGRGKALRLVNKGLADYRPVLKHVLQIYQITVVHMLCKIIRIMKMNQPLLIRLHDLRGQKKPSGEILADLTGHVIPLHAVDNGILIGILLEHLLIVALNQGKNPVVRGVALSHQGSGIAVAHITSGHIKSPLGHDLVFHHILHFFHRNRTVHPGAFKINVFRNLLDLLPGQFLSMSGLVGLGDCSHNFVDIKIHFRSVSFNYLHENPSL